MDSAARLSFTAERAVILRMEFAILLSPGRQQRQVEALVILIDVVQE